MTRDGESSTDFALLCWSGLGVRQQRALLSSSKPGERFSKLGLPYPAEVREALQRDGYLEPGTAWHCTPLGGLVCWAGTRTAAKRAGIA